ncbi:MAG: hypothetical protein ACLRFH_03465 [Opitutales bacterium]
MLNVSKLLKMASIAAGTLGTTWLVAGWCNHCNRLHNGNRCPAETIGAANHPYACNDQAYGCGYDNPYANGYDQGRMQGYNEAYRNFNCLQWFNEWECEGWDSDDEEEYVRQAEERARELRRRRNRHHAQSEARRRQQAVDNIYQMHSLDDLQTILQALQYRAQNLGFQIRDNQIVRPGFNCGGYNPYGCNEMNHYGYNCHNDYGYHCNPYYNYGCGYGCNW